MSTVRPPSPDELPTVQSVGRAAGERFREVNDARIARCADDPPIPIDDLSRSLDAGGLLVAVDDGGVVGYVVFEVLDGRGHVEEIAVLPEAGGRGLGSALLDAVHQWAGAAGLDGVTLTTFRDVAWNRPFYERRGYRVLEDHELTAGLVARRDREAAHGLAPELRVAMLRTADGAPS